MRAPDTQHPQSPLAGDHALCMHFVENAKIERCKGARVLAVEMELRQNQGMVVVVVVFLMVVVICVGRNKGGR